MYNFSFETLLYFARIRQLKGTFRSAAFYGFGDSHDPCSAIIAVQSGTVLSCTIYNRHAKIIEVTETMMNVLHHIIVEWVFDDATHRYTHEQASSFNPPSLPNLSQPSPTPSPQTRNSQDQRTQQLNGMSNPQPSAYHQAPATKNPTEPFSFTVEPHYPVPPNNNGLVQDRFFNLIPLRVKAVPRSEILQWKGNIKSVYMRTNGINTLAQIATMLSLPAADVLRILLQLEKDGLISLGGPT